MARIFYESNYYGVCDFGDSLEHHGILGQKWGVRRYQNKDGTLTAAGKRRYKQIFERGSEDPLYEVSVKRAADKALKSGRIKGYDDDDTADLYDLAVEEALDKDSNIRKHSFLKDDIVSEYQKAKSEERAQKIQNVKDSVKSGIETAKAKAAEFKQAQEERKAASIEKKKEKAIEKGDAKTLLKYSDTMTTNDINDALNRMAAEKRLKDLAYPDRKSTLEKITDAAGTLSSMGNKVVNLKNTYDNLKKAFSREEKEEEGLSLYKGNLQKSTNKAMEDARNNTNGSIAEKEYAAYKVAKERAEARNQFEKMERAEEKARQKAIAEAKRREELKEASRKTEYRRRLERAAELTEQERSKVSDKDIEAAYEFFRKRRNGG